MMRQIRMNVRSKIPILNWYIDVLLTPDPNALLSIASANCWLLLIEWTTRGTKIGRYFLILSKIDPLSSSKPRDLWASIICLISSMTTGINLIDVVKTKINSYGIRRKVIRSDNSDGNTVRKNIEKNPVKLINLKPIETEKYISRVKI